MQQNKVRFYNRARLQSVSIRYKSKNVLESNERVASAVTNIDIKYRHCNAILMQHYVGGLRENGVCAIICSPLLS